MEKTIVHNKITKEYVLVIRVTKADLNRAIRKFRDRDFKPVRKAP